MVAMLSLTKRLRTVLCFYGSFAAYYFFVCVIDSGEMNGSYAVLNETFASRPLFYGSFAAYYFFVCVVDSGDVNGTTNLLLSRSQRKSNRSPAL